METETINNRLEENDAVFELSQALRDLNHIIATELATRDVFKDPLFAAFQICPIIHDLLCMPRGQPTDDLHIRARECFRLAALLYIILVRGKFGVALVEPVSVGSRLIEMLGDVNDFTMLRESTNHLIWVLVVGACSFFLQEDIRLGFVSRLSSALAFLQWTDSARVKEAVVQVAWSEEMFGSSLPELENTCTSINR